MPKKDIISKQLFKRIALDMAMHLFHLEIDEAELLNTETQRIEDRRADLLLSVKAPQHYLLHIEVQNDNDPLMHWRMLRYYVDIALAYPDKPIKQYVLYIGGPRLRMTHHLTNECLHYHYHLIDMHELACDAFLQQQRPDAIVLAILCHFNQRPPRDMVRTIVQRLHQLLQDNPKRLRKYLDILEILSCNRKLQALVNEEKAMLSSIQLSDLPTYQQGMLQGMQQGMQQGEAKILLRQLHAKFGDLPAVLVERIAQATPEQLLSWAEQVLSADNLMQIFSE
jgi:predicted transposase YdaD